MSCHVMSNSCHPEVSLMCCLQLHPFVFSLLSIGLRYFACNADTEGQRRIELAAWSWLLCVRPEMTHAAHTQQIPTPHLDHLVADLPSSPPDIKTKWIKLIKHYDSHPSSATRICNQLFPTKLRICIVLQVHVWPRRIKIRQQILAKTRAFFTLPFCFTLVR